MSDQYQGKPARPGWVWMAAGAAALAFLSNPTWAQAPAAPAADPAETEDPELDLEYEVDELVIEAAAQPRGAVIGDIPPEITLGPREIRALGVSSVTELLEALEPQLASGRGRGGGRPITLVNGGRVSSFSEIRDLPPEAIVRVEILPEEVALRYGYRADQRVVNFVLRRRFRALTTEAGVRIPTDGGRTAVDGNANVLRIQRDTRLQLDVKANRSSSLLESERDLRDRVSGRPFDLVGNVTGSPFGGEIDPALTALAGRPLDVVGLPTQGLTLQDFASTPQRTGDVGAFRSLLPETANLSVNAVLSRPLGEGINASLNARVEMTDSESLLGLATSSLVVPAGNPFSPFGRDVEIQRYAGERGALRRLNDTRNGHLGLSVNGAFSGWRWSFTSNADYTETRSITERGLNLDPLQAAVTAGDPRVNPFAAPPAELTFFRAPDVARSNVTSADAELLLNGALFELPAGPVNAAFTVGGDTRHFESESIRAGLRRSADLSRHVGRAQANLDLPITSRRSGVLDGLGDLSLNANAAVEELSDFGTLTTVGAGLNWSPIEAVRIIASVTEEDGAPTIQQLGDPEEATPAVRVFDFTRGETVEVTRISGGNPALLADSRRVLKLGLTVRPFEETNLTLRADYTRSRTRDLIASFPAATAEIEAAFPERFLRNAEGRLLQVDVRPVNFEREDREELRWGFNYSRPLRNTRRPPFAGRPGGPQGERQGERQGEQQAERQGGAGERRQPQGEGAQGPRGPGGGMGRGGGGRGFGGGRGGGGGAIQLAVFHTVRLENEILIRPGVPVLDLLDGSAIGEGGGTPRHQVDVQAGVSRNGLGARLTARWQSGTEVNGGALGGQDLRFSDLTTVNLRLFADLGLQPFARGRPWLRGARVALSVDNLFNERVDVRDRTGATPVSYQPELLDPLGRTVRVSFRKIFF